MDFRILTVVILAGGIGTRLRKVLPDKPKAIAEVNGRPFITFLLDQINASGGSEVVLCTGFMSDKIRNQIGDTYKNLKINYSEETKSLGTGGSLKLAMPLIASEYFLAMNGDSYVDVSLNDFFTGSIAANSSASILLTKVANTDRYGNAMVSKNGRIVSFEEKGYQSRAGWINAGVYLLKKELIECIPPDTFYSLEKDFFPKIIERGIFGYCCKSRFIDIGTPSSYRKANRFFKDIC